MTASQAPRPAPDVVDAVVVDSEPDMVAEEEEDTLSAEEEDTLSAEEAAMRLATEPPGASGAPDPGCLTS